MRTSNRGGRERPLNRSVRAGVRETPRRWLILSVSALVGAAFAAASTSPPASIAVDAAPIADTAPTVNAPAMIDASTLAVAPTIVEVPPTRVPDRDEATVELGRRLFFDPGASHSKRVACAQCHTPEHGFSDATAKSLDDFGVTPRRSQPVVNLTDARALHWDGEFASIEELVSARTGDTRALNGGYVPQGRAAATTTRKVEPVAESIAAARLYDRAFLAAFGASAPTRENFSKAIAAYVRTLVSTQSPFDRLTSGQSDAVTPAAARGFELFRGRAGCNQCHRVDGAAPAFTDAQFHNTGVSSRRPTKSAAVTRVRLGKDGAAAQDGRLAVTRKVEDTRAFKTPSLRDVAVRAPYMHDGSFATLDAVVRYYAVECGTVVDEHKDSGLKPFDQGKSQSEIDQDVGDLVAFLLSLTGDTRPGMATTMWSERAELMRLRVVDDKGTPYRGTIGVSPGGDVLPASSPDGASPVYLSPDVNGWVEVKPFATTHVRISIPGTSLRPTSGDFVPDTCREGTLTLAESPDEGRRFAVGPDGSAVIVNDAR